MRKTPAIVHLSGINLFKVITSNTENGINLSIPTFKQFFLAWIGMKETLISTLLNEERLSYKDRENAISSHKNLYSCMRTYFSVNFKIFSRAHPYCAWLQSLIYAAIIIYLKHMGWKYMVSYVQYLSHALTKKNKWNIGKKFFSLMRSRKKSVLTYTFMLWTSSLKRICNFFNML